MVEERRAKETADRIADVTEDAVGPLLAPLALAFWRMRSAFERDVGVSAATWFSLSLLAREDGMTQGELGQEFEVDPSRITRLAQKLEKEGLVRRERDPEDNRVVRLYLTGEGRRLVEGLHERRGTFEDRVRGALGDEEIEELKRMLGVLADAMKD